MQEREKAKGGIRQKEKKRGIKGGSERERRAVKARGREGGLKRRGSTGGGRQRGRLSCDGGGKRGGGVGGGGTDDTLSAPPKTRRGEGKEGGPRKVTVMWGRRGWETKMEERREGEAAKPHS